MKRYLFTLCIIAFALCLVGCEEKPQTLNEDSSTTTSTSTTASTTISTDTTSKENDSITTSKKTTSTTTSTTTSFKTTQVRTTSHWNQTTTKRYIIYKDGQTGQNGVDYYKDCDEDNKCRCIKGNGASIECPK